jgi:hypothetical protein
MADGFDRLKGAVADLVRQFTGHTDYHALYPAFPETSTLV